MTRPPRVPYPDRLKFEARIREAVDRYQDPTPEQVCRVATSVAQHFTPWATPTVIANTLVNILGTGWGAIYLDWVHQHAGRRAA